MARACKDITRALIGLGPEIPVMPTGIISFEFYYPDEETEETTDEAHSESESDYSEEADEGNDQNLKDLIDGELNTT